MSSSKDQRERLDEPEIDYVVRDKDGNVLEIATKDGQRIYTDRFLAKPGELQPLDAEEAHAQGLHDDLPRDGCPVCEDRRGRVGL